MRLSTLFLFFLPLLLPAQSVDRLQWFKDAKLGIFIHWGIYAVDGIDESWSFYNGMISHEDYMKQLKGFTAAEYRPEEWADLVRESGARYAVLTAKHHDGVALWDTKANDLDVPGQTPARRDVLTPFNDALRKRGIKVGVYYSLLDWSHEDYPNFTKKIKRYQADSVRFGRFLHFMNRQLDELAAAQKPDLWWFDGDWEFDSTAWRASEIKKKLLRWNPNVIVNSRLAGHGDYATPEQGLPLERPSSDAWELCMTMNENWGYQPTDMQNKSAGQVIQLFTECISRGGNLLLDIGPRADGAIPEEQKTVLKQLGRWVKKHAEAIYGTQAGLPAGCFNGHSTLSVDGKKAYLFLPKGQFGEIMLKGVTRKIQRVYVVGKGQKLEYRTYLKPFWSASPGVTFIRLPQNLVDDEMTVLCVMME